MTQFGIGQPVRRVEDRRFLTGRGHYLDELVDRGFDAALVTPRLLEGLKDDSLEVRQRAAFNLGRLGPKAPARVLQANVGRTTGPMWTALDSALSALDRAREGTG